ncbi:uncharacterized protein LOC143424509 [Xylocopa sonorina]|uniref:uncharacterized protein LOC143424509 n=1 Tax=Xylocopa sonorina TaxID=1818115 RepID=UPI00403AA44E
MFIKDVLLSIPPIIHLPYIVSSTNIAFVEFSWYIFFGVMIINALYTNNIHVLNGCFQQINDSLVRMKETLTNDQPHLLRRVYHAQMNPVLLSKLRALKKQHLNVCEVLQTFNDSFSLQNIIIIVLLVTDITFNMYVYLVVLNKEGRIRTWRSFRLLFMIYHCMYILMLTWYAESIRMQVEQIGTNIHRIIVRTFDEEVITELRMFSFQVLQKDCTIMAKGLVIDATLLTKVLCSITTFLLVLIQFSLVKPC